MQRCQRESVVAKVAELMYNKLASRGVGVGVVGVG